MALNPVERNFVCGGCIKVCFQEDAVSSSSKRMSTSTPEPSAILNHFLIHCCCSTVSASLDFPCTAHAFLPERLSNHCQGLGHISLTFAHNLMLFLCQLHREIAQATYTTTNKRTYEINISTPLRETLCADSQDMLEVSSTVASPYCNCCTGVSTSPVNYGYSHAPLHKFFKESKFSTPGTCRAK
jgi:hypothetical protein